MAKVRKNASLQTVAQKALDRAERARTLYRKALAERRKARESDDPAEVREASQYGGFYHSKCSEASDRWRERATYAWHLARLAGLEGPRDLFGDGPLSPEFLAF